jgi:hypothetical protein
MGGVETLGQIRKHNYALIRAHVKLFLSSAARYYWRHKPFNCPSQQRLQLPFGIIPLTIAALLSLHSKLCFLI